MGKLTFFFDRNVGTRLPESLKRLRPPHDVTWLQEARIPQETPDDVWLETVGKKGWLVVSHDRKFHSISAEAIAVKQHSVGCFYLPGASSDSWEKCRLFMRSFNRMVALAQATPKPFVFRIGRNGHFNQVKL